MKKRLVTMFLAAVMFACGCQARNETVKPAAEHLSRHAPQPGDATPFGVAKGRRQVSTWTVRGGWKAIEPYADIISSVSAFGGISKEFVERCHEANIEVYMPVGGDERAVLTFDTPEHADVAVQALLQRCDDLGVDGVDLDYECFECEWQERYTAFIVALAGELHRTGRKLSICVNALMPGDTGEFARYDPRVIGEVCDQIRVMCYDYIWAGTGRLGPTCTRPWARDAMQTWMKFVPREKLIMGIPAYSHDQDVISNTGNQAWYRTPPVDVSDILKKGTLTYEGINYYVYRNKNQRLRILYASDVYSMKGHLATVDELDIPAISFWTANEVSPEMWQVVRDWMKPVEPKTTNDRPRPAKATKKEKTQSNTPELKDKSGPMPASKPAVTIDLGGGVTMDLVLIRPGSFTMGSGRKVTISRPFYMGKYEVSQQQWKAVMGGNPSDFPGEKSPVERVTWGGCQAFLSKLAEKVPGRTFRLPTEAQWEYACRAGSASEFSFGDEDGDLGGYAWHNSNSGGKTHPVGEKKPNEWGLHDMHGNVAEWCGDWYEHSYPDADATDPEGPEEGTYRVIRGGAYNLTPARCRSADRGSAPPSFCNCCIGFRVVMPADAD